MIPLRSHTFDRGNRRILFALASLALLLRLLPLLRPGDAWTVLDDSQEYLALVRGMHSGCGFARMFDGVCSSPELLRLPGYPSFVAMMPSLRAVVALQALLGTATCLVIGWFTYARWGLVAGVIAETLLALDIPSIVASSTIMSDCLFEATLALAVVLQLSAIGRESIERGRIALALLAAVLLAFAVLLRAVAILLPLFAGAPFLLMPRLAARRRLTLCLIAILIPAAVIFAWTARNHLRTGRWTFTTEGPYNLYYYNAAGVLWYLNGGSLTALQDQLARAIGAKGPDEFVSPGQEREMLARGSRVLLRHPLAAFAMLVRCFLWLAIVPDRANLNALLATNARSSVFLIASQGLALRVRETLRSPLLSAFVALQLPLIISTWIGVVLMLAQHSSRTREELALISIPLGLAVAMMLAGTGPGAIARFRMPAMPFLAMLAGAGWSQAVARRARSSAFAAIAPKLVVRATAHA